jgi:hypothetical protein
MVPMIANIGAHSEPVQLNLNKLEAQNIPLTIRLIDTVTTQMLLKTAISRKLQDQELKCRHHYQANSNQPSAARCGRN